VLDASIDDDEIAGRQRRSGLHAGVAPHLLPDPALEWLRRAHHAIGVWITELPITPERVLRALDAKQEPRREGKLVSFDDELSVNALSDGGITFEVTA